MNFTHVVIIQALLQSILAIKDYSNNGSRYLYPGPQRENFPGGTKVDTGPQNLIGPPKPYRGPIP